MSTNLKDSLADKSANLLFVHQGRANYPELKAYREYFADRFSTAEITAAQARAEPTVRDAICWHVMGYYPRRIGARAVIHDYRSLSVGVAWQAKDWIKAHTNHRPDLRIYQNESIKQALGFRDDVPELLLPMGVPNDVLRYRGGVPPQKLGDFCYIGSMLPERRIDTMIVSFLRHYGSAKTLWLYGEADAALKSAFRNRANVVFAGTVPQNDLFARLRRFEACVCYFPNHHPHILQTPTKLLEYAALGLRIIANEHPQSRSAAREFGLHCWWGSAHDMFEGAPEALVWPDNSGLDPTPMSWRAVIGASGIDAALATLP